MEAILELGISITFVSLLLVVVLVAAALVVVVAVVMLFALGVFPAEVWTW